MIRNQNQNQRESTSASSVKRGTSTKRNAILKKSEKTLSSQDKKRVEVIVNHWLDYEETVDRVDAIAGTFPSVLDRIAKYKGQLPESCNNKPETVGSKVDQVKRLYITNNQRQAYEMIMLVPAVLRPYLTLWFQVKGKHNPATGYNFCRNDMLLYFGVSEKTYKTRTSMAKKILIATDRKNNPSLYREDNKPQEISPRQYAHL